MDKKKKGKMDLKGMRPLRFSLKPSNLLGKESPTYYARIQERPTVDIDWLIKERIVALRTEIREDTYQVCYQQIKEVIYWAIEAGYNIDFGFGKLEMGIVGGFDRQEADFDEDRHWVEPRMTAAPYIYQLASCMKAENTLKRGSKQDPEILFITHIYQEKSDIDWRQRDHIPTGEHYSLFIHGTNISVAGDNPENGILFCNLNTEERHYCSRKEIPVTKPSFIAVQPSFTFTPGNWSITVTTQYSPKHGLLKQSRCITHKFQVD